VLLRILLECGLLLEPTPGKGAVF